MKKRLLMVLLAVALLVTAAAFAVQATEIEGSGTETPEPFNPEAYKCYCTQCGTSGKILGTAGWTEYTGQSLANGKHYYLDGDLGISSISCAQKSGNKTTLVLWNSTLTVTSTARALVYQYTTIDLIGEGTSKLLFDTTTRSSAVQIYGGGTLNLRGTLEVGAADTCDTSYTNGLFKVTGKNTTLNMYDSVKLIAVPLAKLSTDATTGCGGAVWLQNGSATANSSFNMYGGTIEVDGSVYSGGAVYAGSHNKATISGGTIEIKANGTATNAGRAIYGNDNSVVKFGPGSKIIDGGATTVSMVYCKGTLEISGGTTEGKLYATSAGSVKVSGAPQIQGIGIVTSGNSYADVTLGELTTEATADAPAASINVYIAETLADAEGMVFTVADKTIDENTLAAYAKCFNLNFAGRCAVADAEKGVLRGSSLIECANLMSFPEDGSAVTLGCPHCGEVVEWKAVSATISSNHILNQGAYGDTDHFYLPSDITTTGTSSRIQINKGTTDYSATVCLHLNNKTFTTKNSTGNNGTILVSSGNTLNILGEGYVVGSGGVATNIGTTEKPDYWYGASALDCRGTMNIYGGNYSGTSQRPVVALFASSAKKITMHAGTIQGSSTVTADVMTSAVRLNSAGTFEMKGGQIIGANATYGGAVYVDAGTFKLVDGTITGGTATNGGAVYTIGGTFTQSGGTITGGSATSGGAIFVNGGTVTLENGEIKGGTDVTSGAAVFVVDGKTFTMKNGTITGGTAKNGGCLYVDGTFDFVNGTITGGNASYRGGALYVASGGTVNMSGGKIENSMCKDHGGAAFVSGGTFNMSGGRVNVKDYTYYTGTTEAAETHGFRVQYGATLNLSGIAEIHGHGKNNRDIIDVVNGGKHSAMTLADKATVVADLAEDGADESGVYFESDTTLTVKEGWEGTMEIKHVNISGSPYNTFLNPAYVAFEAKQTTEPEPTEPEASEPTTDDPATVADDITEPQVTTFTGKLTLNVEGKPAVIAKENAEGVLQMFVFGAAQVRKLENGEIVDEWFGSNADAVTAYGDLVDTPAYIRLYTTEALELGEMENVYVDINGLNANITCTKPVNVINTNSGYSSANNATVKNINVAPVVTNPISTTNTRYVALGNATDGYTFHPLSIAITGVTVRPESAGMYYRATIQCNNTVKAEIDTYGVAVSVAKMPGTNFDVIGSQALYTSYNDPTMFKSGEAFNGVLINNIMAAGKDDNETRAQKNIYANAYVYIKGIADPIMADEDNQGNTTATEGFNGVVRNLKGLMPAVDAMFAVDGKLDADQKNALIEMYKKFESVMGAWELTNIKAAFEAANSPA